MPIPSIVTHGTVYAGQPTGGSTQSFNVSVSTSCMYLFLIFSKKSGNFPYSILFNGAAPTQLATTGSAMNGAAIYGVLYPPSGSKTITWTNTSSPPALLLVYQIQVSLGNTITKNQADVTYTTTSLSISITPDLPDNLFISAAGSAYSFVDPLEKTGATILYGSNNHVVCYKQKSGLNSAGFGYESSTDPQGWGASTVAITGIFGQKFRILGFPGL
jgi:hypothetical protein